MDIDIINKLDEIISIIDNSKDIKRLLELKNKILSDNNLKDKLDRIKKLDIYTNEYKILKNELLSNKDIKEYKFLENELYLLTLSINKKLNELTNKRLCHANN